MITDDPEGRGICGSSSGGICAFNAAWQRPDQFRKVYSTIGSFTLAVEKAREKLKKFQLTDPTFYILQLVEGIIASGRRPRRKATSDSRTAAPLPKPAPGRSTT